jgi:hypothetical protein
MSESELKEITQVRALINKGQLKEALKIASDLEKKDNISDRDLMLCKFLKSRIFCRSTQYLEAFDYTNQVLEEAQRLGDSNVYLDALSIQANSYILIGNLIQGENILIQVEELLEKLKKETEIDLRERESYIVRIRANLISLKGDSILSQKLYKKALELAKDSEDQELLFAALGNLGEGYQKLRDYDRAIYYIKRSIEVPYPPLLKWRYGILIESLIGKNNIDEAKNYLLKMSELIEKEKAKVDDTTFQYYKALILKTSLRAKDRVEAEEIFKYIIEEKNILDFQVKIKSLINICGLLLIELRITNDIGILSEINPYIEKLLNFSKRQHSYWFFAETYILQAKLSLLTFNIKEARRFLIQAQKIAEKFVGSQLVQKISKECEELIRNINSWNNLKNREAPMAERIELAQLDELIESMTQKRIIATSKVLEHGVAISKEKKICLVCKGDILKFSYICECGAIYCDTCARALSNLENVCWVCEAGIDPLKPIKPYAEEIEEHITRKIN